MAEQAQPLAVPVEELKGRKLGRILTKMGKVTRDQVQEALQLQEQRRAPLGQLLVELGYVDQNDISVALAAQAGMEVIDLEEYDIPEDVVHLITAETANAYQVLPISYEKDKNLLTVAMRSAENFRAIDDLRLLMGFDVRAVVAPGGQLEKRLNAYYGEDEESLSALIEELSADKDIEELADEAKPMDLEEQVAFSDDNRVKRLLNLVLLQAIKDKASDVHFEPFENEFKMRYRIDGVLYEMIPPPKQLALPVISRIKVMANLDIAEQRLPQDGRIELTVQGNPVDLRVAILPTMFGESAVLRILDRSAVQLDLDRLGMRPEDLTRFRELIYKPNGIVVVTGPTGSGKTTTLYAALRERNNADVKILTAEDPVEYDIDGLIQVQVNPSIEMTFARALRSFLRQDPDIILVGETRDLETARIAVQASLTGHLVFTTLHTNDAPSSVARLVDLGLEPFLVTATMEGVVAQRLVRKICPRCRREYKPSEEQLMRLELRSEDVEGRTFYHGVGCDFCNQTGYRGRVGLFEIMAVDDEMRDLIVENASTQVLRGEALKRGMRTLRQVGVLSIFDGLTTIDEVVRGTMVED